MTNIKAGRSHAERGKNGSHKWRDRRDVSEQRRWDSEEMGKKENKRLREDLRGGKEKKVPFQEQKGVGERERETGFGSSKTERVYF